MKKYYAPGFLLISIFTATYMVVNKPSAKMEERSNKIPFVKTMMLLPQVSKAQISSQAFIRPKTELNFLSQLNARVELISKKMEEGLSFNIGDTLIKLDKIG